MSNNAEYAFIHQGPKLAKAQAAFRAKGEDVLLVHTFFSPRAETTDLVRRLRVDGFSVYEDDASPKVYATRSETVELDLIKRLIRDMCDLAEKFSVEYDGWKLKE